MTLIDSCFNIVCVFWAYNLRIHLGFIVVLIGLLESPGGLRGEGVGREAGRCQ